MSTHEVRRDDGGLTGAVCAARKRTGEEDRARVEDALTSLQALRSAMAAGPAAVGAARSGEPRGGLVRSRLLSFETAIRALREPERPPRI